MLLSKCESEFSRSASELSTAISAVKNGGNCANSPSCLGYVCDLEIYLKLLQTLWRRYVEEGKQQQFLDNLATIVSSIVKMASMAHTLCKGDEAADIQYICKKANALESSLKQVGGNERQGNERQGNDSQLMLF